MVCTQTDDVADNETAVLGDVITQVISMTSQARVARYTVQSATDVNVDIDLVVSRVISVYLSICLFYARHASVANSVPVMVICL